MAPPRVDPDEKRRRYNERMRKYYHANRDTMLERAKISAKKYYDNNADKCRAKARERHAMLLSSHKKMLEVEDLERRTFEMLNGDEEFHDCVETSI